MVHKGRPFCTHHHGDRTNRALKGATTKLINWLLRRKTKRDLERANTREAAERELSEKESRFRILERNAENAMIGTPCIYRGLGELCFKDCVHFEEASIETVWVWTPSGKKSTREVLFKSPRCRLVGLTR